LGKQLDTEKLIDKLRTAPAGSVPDAIRLHIPRALRLVYDIRNKRDLAHLADGIDPNLQDAILITGVVDWVLAEFVRLFHSVPANEAQTLVQNIVERRAPIIQDFNGHLKLLSPGLGVSDHCLVLLYQCGASGASLTQLRSWVRPKMRSNLRRALSKLEDELDLIHFDGQKFRITRLGQLDAEKRELIQPD
jgi:hypothetical protein